MQPRPQLINIGEIPFTIAFQENSIVGILFPKTQSCMVHITAKQQVRLAILVEVKRVDRING